jgi:phosphoribosyl 1,2-cyclic phosphodiesterase
MILKVLGSSSAGNCYILENDSEALILEAGIRFSEVKHALNYNIKKIVCCLITHEHKDHAGHINEFLNDAVTVWASEGTIKNITLKGFRLPLFLEAGTLFKAGGFRIIPFETKHDAAEPMGFFINHPETGNVLFATDTYYLPCTFSNLNNILIEANYRMDILEENTRNGRISAAQRNRTLQSHMSYETCLKTLLANDLSKVNNIVLIHLSNDNSNAINFQEGIRKATGKTTHVADNGIVINFNKTPF